MRCLICGGEMGTAGCMQAWKHPRPIPVDGPGSHAWDVAEMQAQRARADKADSEIASLRAEVERLTANYDAACAGWRGTVQERDEARASLAARDAEIAEVIAKADRLTKTYLDDAQAAKAECARLREEALTCPACAAEFARDSFVRVTRDIREEHARGFAAGVEAAAKVAEDRCCMDGCTCCDFERNTVDLIRDLRPSPAPSPAPSPKEPSWAEEGGRHE